MSPAVLTFDGYCSLCARWARLLQRVSGGRILLENVPGAPAPRLREACGRACEGFDVVVRLTSLIPALMPLWPFVRLPGMAYLGPRLFLRAAELRFRLSERLAGR